MNCMMHATVGAASMQVAITTKLRDGRAEDLRIRSDFLSIVFLPIIYL